MIHILLVAEGEVPLPVSVSETVNGNVYTYATSSFSFWLLVCLGLGALGAAAYAFLNEGAGGWLKKVMAIAFALFGVCALFGSFMTRNNAIVVTPEYLESRTGGTTKRIEFADLHSIEWFTTKEWRGRRVSTVQHTVFHMRDGTQYERTGELMLAASRRAKLLLEQRNPALARQNSSGQTNWSTLGPRPAPPLPPRPEDRQSPQTAHQPPPAMPPAAPSVAPPSPAAQAAVPQDVPLSTAPQDAPPTAAPQDEPAVAQQVPRASDVPKTVAADGSSSSPTPSATQVTAATPLRRGMRLQGEWAARIYPVEVVELLNNGTVKIHYVGWSDSYDEVVPRSRLWVEPDDLAKADGHEPHAAPPAMRTWTDASGKFTVEAELASFKDGKVRLRRADGKEMTLPIGKLSADDQKFVRKHQAAPASK